MKINTKNIDITVIILLIVVLVMLACLGISNNIKTTDNFCELCEFAGGVMIKDTSKGVVKNIYCIKKESIININKGD